MGTEEPEDDSHGWVDDITGPWQSTHLVNSVARCEAVGTLQAGGRWRVRRWSVKDGFSALWHSLTGLPTLEPGDCNLAVHLHCLKLGPGYPDKQPQTLRAPPRPLSHDLSLQEPRRATKYRVGLARSVSGQM